MRIYHMLCLVLALIIMAFATTPASAMEQEEYSIGLPTAVSSPLGQWTHMREGSHEATSADARRQCRRNVDAGEIAIGYEGCDRLKSMRDAGEYVVVGVPDGITFNVMNGFNPDRGSFSTIRTQKSLNRIDRAELYDMGTDAYGNRVYAYFFTGEDTSCNNVAWVIIPPEPEPVVPYQAERQPPPEPVVQCRLVRVGGRELSGTLNYLPGFLLSSCCPECMGPTLIPGQLFMQDSGGSRASYIRVCEQIQEGE